MYTPFASESAYVSEFTMILHIFRLCEFAILCHMNFTGDEFHNCEIHAFNIGESCDFHSFSCDITVVEFTRFTLDFVNSQKMNYTHFHIKTRRDSHVMNSRFSHVNIIHAEFTLHIF